MGCGRNEVGCGTKAIEPFFAGPHLQQTSELLCLTSVVGSISLPSGEGFVLGCLEAESAKVCPNNQVSMGPQCTCRTCT